jgi:D-amino-acid oxidase
LNRLTADALPDGYVDGLELTVPVVDMPVHLRWLTDQLRRSDVTFTFAHLDTLEQATPGVDLVINCSGLGARALARDDSLYPVRGQVVLVRQLGVRQWLLDESDPSNLTYIVPRRDTVVLGGTALEGDADERVRAETAADILQRAISLMPALAGAEVLAHRVGLRPARPSVRLEREGDVVHCYGHGGAGVTLAYGCAQDVADLLA